MRKIAFYLPQFHQIPENDEWWGEGFTEWVNVRRAKPQFHGHSHPRRPTTLGEYDLNDRETLSAQSDLARKFGIDGFCIYLYSFDGRRLLEKPLESWRSDPTLLPYCISWANESWTRRWDGKNHHVLMPQSYNRGFEEQLFGELVDHFRAPHYMTMGGSPIVVVHRADQIPQPDSFARSLRQRAHTAGLPGLYLVAAETTPDLRPGVMEFDAIVEFPPVGANTLATAQLRPVPGLSPGFQGRLMSYDRLAHRYSSRSDVEYVRHRCVVPSWDNTARRQASATIYTGASPAKYAEWLAAATTQERRQRGENGLVFVNAWNEWAEGAYLEPDELHGFDYLIATRDARFAASTEFDTDSGASWTYAHARSVAQSAGGSLLARYRRFRNRG